MASSSSLAIPQEGQQETDPSPRGIRYLDLVQMDKDEFNARQKERREKFREENGLSALQNILYGDRHHELKASRSVNYSLSEDELKVLREEKVLLTRPERAQSFASIMLDLYNNDMPVFITSDAILYAFHRFYDNWLKQLEVAELTQKFRGFCEALLAELRRIPRTDGNADLLRDLEVYFLVPIAILNGVLVEGTRGGWFGCGSLDLPQVHFGGRSLLQKTLGTIKILRDHKIWINGVQLELNGTSLKPRGHYTSSPELRNYFTAFTWLSTFVVPMKLENEDLAATVARVQLAAAIAKISKPCISVASDFYGFISRIVGEPDSYTLPTFLPLIDDLVPDEGALDWILGNGEELLESLSPRLEKRATLNTVRGDITNPALYTFSLIGRGNPIDNLVIQRMVDQHLKTDAGELPAVPRKLPRIHDLVFTLFNNDAVRGKLEEEMDSRGYTYWDHLRRVQEDVAEHEHSATLYSQELKMLRALSADRTTRSPYNTRAWGHKQAQTQIAHYSELRHDNVLYLGEPVGCYMMCEHPDIVIEPVPTFWAEFAALVEMMTDLAGNNSVLSNFKLIIAKFREFLRQQEQGAIDPALIEELKATIKADYLGSGPPDYKGWYISLFEEPEKAFNQKPEVSSMFSAPPDQRGEGGIVHLGTGKPGLMYILVSEDNGDEKVLLGPTYSAYEVVTEYKDRLNDEEWAAQLSNFEPGQF